MKRAWECSGCADRCRIESSRKYLKELNPGCPFGRDKSRWKWRMWEVSK